MGLQKIFLVMLGLFLTLSASSAVRPELRSGIEAAYAKAALAARFKFVEGLLCHRAKDFKLYTPEGKQVDLSVERQRFLILFDSATRVRLETKVYECEERAGFVLCRVEQLLRLEDIDGPTRRLVTTQVKTLTVDRWEQRGKLLRLVSSHVERQEMGQGDALPAVFVRPTLFKAPGRS